MIAARSIVHLGAAMIVAVVASRAALADDIPVQGVPVPELAGFDDAVIQIMTDNDVVGCAVGVMKDDCVVYQRGFGWRDDGVTPMPENATMRLASVSKVLVKRAIHMLEGEGLNLSDKAFDLGQPGGGILSLDPWPNLQDDRMRDISIEHLLDHEAGWAEDYSFLSIDIAEAMEIGSPPSLENVARYALGQNLADDPGNTFSYSNFGYNVLVLVIEEFTGETFYSYVRQNILTTDMWVPSTDLFAGQPFSQIGLREPEYFARPQTWELSVPNVYDPEGANVPWPYGGFDMEAMLGSSGIVASAAPMLTFASLYPERWIGSMPGSSTRIMTASTDGDVHIAAMCNIRLPDEGDNNWAGDQIALAIDEIISNGVSWPTMCVDGQWIDCAGGLGVGSFDDPYGGVDWALANVTPGSKLLFHPGDNNWTGVMDMKLLLQAPLGAARIGTNANCN